jgi:hypothetical protein
MQAFRTELFSGKVIAHGFVLPIQHGRPAMDIPALEWDFLQFDDTLENARGQGISHRIVYVRRA